MSVFSERMKAMRIACDLTQDKLGEKLGMPGRRVRMYENGEQEPSVMRAAAIARALETSLDYLAGLKDEEDSQ